MSITIFVGDTGEYLSDIATSYDVNARLITLSDNLDLTSGTYYTSTGDLTDLEKFKKVLAQADVIIYQPPSQWSSIEIMQYTEDYLTIFSYDTNKKIINFELPKTLAEKMMAVVDHRKTDSQQIWVAGCSISHSLGVSDTERYGHLLSQDLGLPVSYLTCPGSSIRWASDQILRSDIRSGDIVFWGVTSPNRFSYWNEFDQQMSYAILDWFDKHEYLNLILKKKYLVSEHIMYDSVAAIHNVLNFCDKNNVRLVIGSLLIGIEPYLKDVKNFVLIAGTVKPLVKTMNNMYLDNGTDGTHPGPKSHVYFRDKFLSHYNKIYS